jgi:hypothetical protein
MKLDVERNVAQGPGACPETGQRVVGGVRPGTPRQCGQTVISNGKNPARRVIAAPQAGIGIAAPGESGDNGASMEALVQGYHELEPRESDTCKRESPPIPPGLANDLAELLAEALVADLRAFPNVAADQAVAEATVNSPWGHDRRSETAPTTRPPSAVALACRGP